jgi:hypothetical protein
VDARAEIIRRFMSLSASHAGTEASEADLFQFVELDWLALSDAPNIQALRASGQTAEASYVVLPSGEVVVIASWPCGSIKLYPIGAIADAA